MTGEIRNQNIAMPGAHVGMQAAHISGGAHITTSGLQPSITEQLQDLRAALTLARRHGQIDGDTFEAADAELIEATAHVAATDESGRAKFVRAMRKFKGLIEEISGLAAKVTTIIAAAKGA